MSGAREQQRVHDQSNCSGLRYQLSATPLAGRWGRARSSDSVSAGICGGSGFGSLGICATCGEGGPSAVCSEFAFENMALWILASDSFASEVGAGVPQRTAAALADWDDLSRSQYVVAFLAG